jgi:hypothetical protein
MLSVLLSLTFSVINPQIDTVYNSSSISEIDGRDVRFGVVETVEEIILEKGLELLNQTYSVEILLIESPQEIINIAGTKWLKKNYIVKTAIIHEGIYYYGEGKRKTVLFAMFLDVENGEVPLNRKAFSKALQSSLEDAVNVLAKK